MELNEGYWDIYNQIKQNMFYVPDNNNINSHKGKYLIEAVHKNESRPADTYSPHQIATRGIAHDINNMLSVIMGYLDIILTNNELNANDRQYLLKAIQASQILGELNSLLLKGGAEKKKCENIRSVVKLIQQTVEVILGVNTNYTWDISYTTNIGHFSIPCLHLKRIIQNLVKNAQEAMPGGGHLSILIKNVILDKELPPAYHGGKYVQITIHDEGYGIPEDKQKNLFYSGFTSKENGNGVGLKITYHLIQLNNGIIKVSSEPGSGTSFHIFFPIH